MVVDSLRMQCVNLECKPSAINHGIIAECLYFSFMNLGSCDYNFSIHSKFFCVVYNQRFIGTNAIAISCLPADFQTWFSSLPENHGSMSVIKENIFAWQYSKFHRVLILELFDGILSCKIGTVLANFPPWYSIFKYLFERIRNFLCLLVNKW